MSLVRARALALWLSVAGTAGGAFVVRDAQASVSIAVTLEGLLKETSAAVVVTPVEQKSLWENGRIYTYTRVKVERGLAGDLAADSDAWVRTMGGAVGNIGQQVDGEAVLTIGRSTLLFLHPGPAGLYEVTARGQGQYALVTKENRVHVIRNGNAGMLLPPQPAAIQNLRPLVGANGPTPLPLMAAEALHDRPVDDVARDIAVVFRRVHAPR